MNREAIGAAAQAATVAGLASLFLPNIETAWDTDGDPFIAKQLDTGTVIYLGVSLAVGGLYSLSAGSPFPVIVAGIMAGLVVVTLRLAYNTPPVNEGMPDAAS